MGCRATLLRPDLTHWRVALHHRIGILPDTRLHYRGVWHERCSRRCSDRRRANAEFGDHRPTITHDRIWIKAALLRLLHALLPTHRWAHNWIWIDIA